MKEQSLKKNFVMNALLTVSSFLFPLITFPYVSRVLGPDGTGKVQFATSLVSYFSMFAQLGIPTYGVRACARVRDDREKLTRTVHELLMINLVMNLVIYAALGACLILVPRIREEKTLVLILSLSVVLTSVGMEWLYKALEQYTYITVRSLIFKTVALAATFALIHTEQDYVIYGAITIFASSASCIFNLFSAHRHIGFRPVGGYHPRRHLRPVLIFFAMACATTVYTNLDNVMLGFMTTDADVGFYGAAVKIKTILVSMVTSLGVVLLPRSSYYVEQGNRSEFRRITKKALNFVILAAVPMSVYFMMYAREGILTLSGAAYEEAVVPMQIIMPTLILIGITNILGIQTLVPLGKERTVLHSEIAGAAVDIVLNALLIPSLHSAGAAIGTLAAEFVVLAVQCYALREELREMSREIRFQNVILGTLLAALASAWVPFLGLKELPALLASAAVFFGIYGGFLLLRKEPLIREMTELILQKAGKRRMDR